MTIAINDPRLKIASRNIVLMMIGKLSSLLGASIYTFAMGLYVLKTTGSATSFAITLVCGSIPRMLCGPIAGAIADRVNRRALVIGADILSALIMFTMFILSTTFGTSLLFIYVSAALLSICASFYTVAFTSSIPSLVNGERIQQASALNQTASSLATLLGPIIGGVVYGFLSTEFFFLLNGIAFSLAVVVQLFIVFGLYETAEHEGKVPFLTSIKDGFTYIKSQQNIYMVIKIAFWLNFFGASVAVILPYIIVQELHLSGTKLGIIEGMFAGGMIVASVILSARKEVTDKIGLMRNSLFTWSGLLFMMALPLFLPFSKTMIFIYYIGLMFLNGMTLIFVNVPMQVFVQKSVPPHYLGRVFGLLETVATAIMPLGTILYGILLDYVPASTVIIVTGIGALIVVGVGTRQWGRKQQVNVSA